MSGSGTNPSTKFQPNLGQRVNPNSGSGWVYVRGGKEMNGLDYVSKGGGSSHIQDVGNKRNEGPRDKGIRHLSYKELMDRKQRGLCFKCGGPFHPMHKFPDRQLRIMVLDELEDEGDEGNVLAMEMEDDDAIEGECNAMSLDGMTNTESHNSETLRLKGRIKGVPILIFVDSGATHNFISKRLTGAMGWPVDDSKEMRVKLGDEHKTRAWGKCKDLKVEVGDTEERPWWIGQRRQ
ncbi:Aspartic peptidase domain superfamily [Sesbania bispinosa]|nr:Aspartic peptidase domain superfamily [Sesbania bispinosa]